MIHISSWTKNKVYWPTCWLGKSAEREHYMSCRPSRECTSQGWVWYCWEEEEVDRRRFPSRSFLKQREHYFYIIFNHCLLLLYFLFPIFIKLSHRQKSVQRMVSNPVVSFSLSNRKRASYNFDTENPMLIRAVALRAYDIYHEAKNNENEN